ncbi:MAG: TatD family nuclease-associated radical SAM protein [Clostridia bacterium]
MDTYVYKAYGNLYINLTNKCSNSCYFCIRNGHDGICYQPLCLTRDPSSQEVIDALPEDLTPYKMVVFCGFGEPTCQLDTLLEVAKFLKLKGAYTRVNTNGCSDAINKKPTAHLFKNIIDDINVSLNASNKEKYDSICHSEFGIDAFYIMLQFAINCRNEGINVNFSIVDIIGAEEIAACQKLCDGMGIPLRIRPFE